MLHKQSFNESAISSRFSSDTLADSRMSLRKMTQSSFEMIVTSFSDGYLIMKNVDRIRLKDQRE